MEKKGTDTEIGKEDDERRTDLILEKISELLKRTHKYLAVFTDIYRAYYIPGR